VFKIGQKERKETQLAKKKKKKVSTMFKFNRKRKEE